MKRSFLAAGVGICIFAATMFTSNHTVTAQEYNGTFIEQDTTPKKKDTSEKEPDTLKLQQSSPAVSQR
jgi:hypothetical protein